MPRAKKPVKKKTKQQNNKRSNKKTKQEVNAEEIKKLMAQAVEKETGTIKKISTGIKELDKMIKGGFPFPGVILVLGKPGVGKTPFAIAYAHEGIMKGQKSIYVCLNNFPEEIKAIAKSIGYDLESAEFIDAYSWLIGKKSEYEDVSALDPTGILELMEEKLKKGPVERVVLDSLSTMFLYHDEKTIQRFVQAFTAMIKEYDASALILVEEGTCSPEMISTLEYLTDGTILLENKKLFIARLVGIEVKKKEAIVNITKKGIEIEVV